MASINFIDYSTEVPAAWLNDVDAIVYDVFDGGVSAPDVALQGDMHLGDSQNIYWGTSDDFSIYHDGANNYLRSTYGQIRIQNVHNNASNYLQSTSSGLKNCLMWGGSPAKVQLSYNGAVVLDTSSTGVDVTGSLDVTDAPTTRTNLGLGDLAVKNTVNDGDWSGTDLAIANGGSGQSTAQAAIDALSQVSAATDEHVLTKDTASGNAIWKAATGGSGEPTRTGVAGGTVNAITSTLSPALSSLTDNALATVEAAGANTSTTVTFAPDGLTAKNIKRIGNQALLIGDIYGAGHRLILQYDSANDVWELLNPAQRSDDTLQGNRVAKVWVNLDGTGTIAIRDSFNVASLTDNGTGDYTITFSEAMASTDFAWAGSCNQTLSSGARFINGPRTAEAAGSLRVLTMNSAATLTDMAYVNVIIFGDQ